jgi:hypothetical protein
MKEQQLQLNHLGGSKMQLLFLLLEGSTLGIVANNRRSFGRPFFLRR